MRTFPLFPEYRLTKKQVSEFVMELSKLQIQWETDQQRGQLAKDVQQLFVCVNTSTITNPA